MKVLFLHLHFSTPEFPGNNRSYDICKSWADCGHEVLLFTGNQIRKTNNSEECCIVDIGIERFKVISLDVKYSHFQNYLQRIYSFYKFHLLILKYRNLIENIDLIYASSTPPSVAETGRILAEKLNKPLVIELVDLWPEVPHGMQILPGFIAKLINLKMRRLYNTAQKIICLSPGMLEILENYGIPKQKLFLSYNGTDSDAFKPLNKKKEELKIVYSGTIGKANGLENLIYAVKILENRKTNLKIDIIGNGNRIKLVKDLSKKLKTTNVTFKPGVPKESMPQKLIEYAIGVVCFAPYKILETNSANKLYDYLASGLPVVINYKGWQADLLEKYQCGLSSNQMDNESLASNLELLATNPDLRQKMSANAVALAKELFDRKKLADELMEIMQTLL